MLAIVKPHTALAYMGNLLNYCRSILETLTYGGLGQRTMTPNVMLSIVYKEEASDPGYSGYTPLLGKQSTFCML